MKPTNISNTTLYESTRRGHSSERSEDIMKWFRGFGRIRPNRFTHDESQSFSSLKGLVFLVFYLYCLIVLTVYDFTVVGLIGAIIIPVAAFFLLAFRDILFEFSLSRNAGLFFVVTLGFLFLKNIVSIIKSIAELFGDGIEGVFYLPVVASLFFIPGIVMAALRSWKLNIAGFALCGFAVATCQLLDKSRFKFMFVYAVICTAYGLVRFLSTVSHSGVKQDFDDYKRNRVLNLIIIGLSIVFALVYRENSRLLNWDHVSSFINMVFSPALMFPTMVFFSMYYIWANYWLTINVLEKANIKLVYADQRFVKLMVMLYVLCCVLYHHYFTLNWILIVLFMFAVMKKIENLTFIYFVIADILISIGRTETAVVIGVVCLYFSNRFERDSIICSKYDKDGKRVYTPSTGEVLCYAISQESFWLRLVCSIIIILASLLLHTKTGSVKNVAIIGYIGLPNVKFLMLMVVIAVVCVCVINLFFYRSGNYKPRYAYLVVVLVFMFLTCFAVIKKETPYLRIDPVDDQILVTYNLDEADVSNYFEVYRGSNIPFMSSLYSDTSTLRIPSAYSFTLRYPQAESVWCERTQMLIGDKHGLFTSYDFYYPMIMRDFFEWR